MLSSSGAEKKRVDPGPVDLANELRPLILQLHRHLRREVTPLGITAGQAALLHAIRTSPGAGMRELAAREGISAPRLTVAVDGLEAAGLVTRTRSGSDRRRAVLGVTEDGVKLLRSVRRRRTAWLAEQVSHLSTSDRDALAAAVPALRALTERAA